MISRLLHRIAGLLGYQLLRREAIVYHSTSRDLYLHALGCPPKVILDIGANRGEMTAGYLAAFPEAEVHAFEPFPDSFDKVVARFRGDGRVKVHPLALGSEAGESRFHLAKSHQEHSLKEVPEERAAGESITVEVDTLDGFAEREGIEAIDVIKTDTEGMEVEVLRGARNLLENGAIGCVLAEVGFGGEDRHHLTTENIAEFLEPHGLTFYGLYDLGYLDGRLHFANALFCRPR